MDTNVRWELDTQEIAETLLSHCCFDWYDDEKEVCAELEEAIYWIKCAAKNEHEADRWRVLWKVLNEVAAMKGVLLPF